MGGDRFSSGDASARGGRSRGRRHRRRHRRPVGETHRSGYDAGKKIKGGKRHIVTDTGGLPIAVMVHEADIRDRAVAPGLLASTAISYPWPSHIFAEGGYGGGKLRGALDKTGERTIEIIERSDTAKGVESLPRHRVVERTFARPGRCRREAKDVEATIKSAVARITIASIRLMISRLART